MDQSVYRCPGEHLESKRTNRFIVMDVHNKHAAIPPTGLLNRLFLPGIAASPSEVKSLGLDRKRNERLLPGRLSFG